MKIIVKSNEAGKMYGIIADETVSQGYSHYFNYDMNKNELEVIHIYDAGEGIEEDEITPTLKTKSAIIGECNAFAYKEHLSDDRMSIQLPVPLGSTVYNFSLGCFDGCLLQKSHYEQVFPDLKGCNGLSPCHTRINNIKQMAVTIDNIGFVLSNWGIRLFATEAEALEKANQLIEENKKYLQNNGFLLDENGYSIKEKVN